MDSLESAHRHFRAAEIDEAARMCERLIQADDSNGDAWHLLSWCEFQKGNLSRAVQGAGQATRHNQHAWKCFHDLGFFLRRAEQDERAVPAFLRAVELEPEAVPAWVQLGAALTTLGRFEDAGRAHRRAVSLDPTAATQSLLALVELEGYGASQKELATLEKAYDTIRVGRERAQLGFALGRVWEKRREPAKAFDYYTRANAERRRHGHLNVARHLTNAPGFLDQFGQQAMADAEDSGLASHKPIFIVGMPRSGTTLVERLLARHPEVTAGGESGEFSRLAGGVVRQLPADTPILQGLTPNALAATGKSYLDYLQARFPGAARVTEKLPVNFTLVGLMAKIFPRAKVLWVERDPVDTCWSCWTTAFSNPTLAFTQEELGGFQALAEHCLSHWRRVCPDHVHVIRYEALVRETEKTMRAALEALELPWDAACAATETEGGEAVRTASAVTVRRAVSRSSIGRSRPFRDRLQPLIGARTEALASLTRG